MEKERRKKQTNIVKKLAQFFLVLALLLYIVNVTTINSFIKVSKDLTYKADKPIEAYNENEAIDDLLVDVTPTRGEVSLEEGGIVHEGEYIKYNIIVKNNTDETMKNVKIVASIPEGVEYGEVTSNFEEIRQPYFYTFNEELKEKEIVFETLEAGQSQEVFYEVKVKDLAEGETEKTIATKISAYIGNALEKEYNITNIVEPADVQMFMGAFTEYGGKHYILNIKSDTQETVDVKIHFPKSFDFFYISGDNLQEEKEFDYIDSEPRNEKVLWSESGRVIWMVENEEGKTEEVDVGNQISVDISDDKVLTTTLETNKLYSFVGSITNDVIKNSSEDSNVVLNAYAETADGIYMSNETRIDMKLQNVEISISSDNADSKVKYGEEINYDVTIKNIGSRLPEITFNAPNYVAVNLLNFLPEGLDPVSISYETWDMIVNNENATSEIGEKTEITKDISGISYDEEGNRKENVNVSILIPKDEVAHARIKAKAGFMNEETLIENMVRVEGEEIHTKISDKVSHTILPYNYVDPDVPENPGTDNPGIDNPEPENPGTENPGTDNPGTDNPGTDNPEPEKPGTDNPAPVIPVEPTNSNTDNTRKNLDFEINKYISKVTVSTVNGTKEYKFNNEQLAKTEIRAKEMNGATVVVEYKIVVKNIGNVAGKIGEIADYLPAGLTFSSQLNKEWIQSTDGKLKYSGNSDYIMQAGEAKTITLIATKQMSQNTTGNFINRAEIKNISTTSGLKETNTENNASQAELIISTSTGAYVYIGIGILALTALIILAVILVKKGKLNIKKIRKTTSFMILLGIVLITGLTTQVEAAYWHTSYTIWTTSPGSSWSGGFTCTGGGITVPVNGTIDGKPASIQTVTWEGRDWLSGSSPISPVPGTKKELKLEKRNDEIEMHESGDNFVFGPFEYYSENADTFRCLVNGGSVSYSGAGFGNGSNSFYLTIPKSQCLNGISRVELITEGIEEEDWYVYRTWGAYFSGIQPVYNYFSDRGTEHYEERKTKRIEWTNIRGAFEIEKVDKDNPNIKMANVSFRITGPSVNGVYTTDKNGKILIDNVVRGTYTIVEEDNPNYGYIAEVKDSFTVSTGQFVQVKEENTKYTGNLKIKKIDPDTGKPMPGVEFTIRKISGKPDSSSDGQYIETGTGVIDNVTFTSTPYRYKTDDSGEILIYNLWVGTYEIKEVSIDGYDYYDCEDPNYVSWSTSNGGSGQGTTATIEVQRRTSYETSKICDAVDFITFKNTRKYVDLSGKVWEDMIEGKGSLRDSLYDEGDKLLDHVDVKIIENGEVAKRTYRGQQMSSETRTGEDGNETGSYKFEKLEIDKLKDYSIEFTYNGMSYGSIPAIDLVDQNGSKALEGSARDEFNDRYTTIENKQSSQNSGEALDGNGTETSLSYDKKEYGSTLNYEGNPVYGYEGQNFPINDVAEKFLIKSTTENAYGGGLDKAKSPEEIRQQEIEEITDINQGLFERERVDLFLTNDINSVMTKIKGYTHIYEYGKRFAHREENPDEFHQLGVKFGEKYVDTYTQPIYRSDYSYESSVNDELEIYITYQIDLTNQSTGITTTVNKVIDYYDPQYEINAIGTSYNTEEGTVGDLAEFDDNEYNNEYKKAKINANIEIQPQETKSVYVQFKLTREKIAEILKDLPEGAEGRNLNNVAEIATYSSTQDGKKYGMIDKNSNPENAIPGDQNTYENDTDAAPDFRLKVAQDRTLEGNLFLDQTSTEMRTGEERLGSGKYEDGESAIKDVIVRLKEGDNVVQEVRTSSDDGTYKFSNFEPGKYTIEYEWSNNTVTDGTQINVYDYKGTVYNNPEREADEFWYKDLSTRNSDAKDNYDERVEIDNLTSTVDYRIKDKDLNKSMVSTTPLMNVKIEYTDIDKTNIDEILKNDAGTVIHEIKDVDFGIVERPRQQLELNKEVSKVIVRLANGQLITETSVDPTTGELIGNNLINMRENSSANPKNGFIKIEMDNELIQGATIEVEYTIIIKNNSELDYINQEYYHYGTNKTNILTLKPTKIIDYLDKDVAYDEGANKDIGGWVQLDEADLNEKVDPSIYEDRNSKVKDKRILHTEYYKDTVLEPGETVSNPLGIKITKLLTSKFGTQNFIEGNESEIIEIQKNGGRTPTKTELSEETEELVTTSTVPGNYIPSDSDNPSKIDEPDEDLSEEITVVPSTGANLNFIIPIATGIVVLVIIGVGVYFIKKRVIDNK